MGKIYKLSDSTTELINELAENAGLLNYINIMTFGAKQKEAVKAKKANPTEEFIGKSDCVLVYVNEDVFIKLDDEQQRILIEDVLNGVLYDDEKDKLNVSQPEIKMSLGGWRKYGEKLVNALETSILVRQQMEEEEKERRAAKKAAKNG